MSSPAPSPRPGGFIKNLNLINFADPTGKNSASLSRIASRDKRITKILEETEWGINTSSSEDVTAAPWDNMLAITISCVMLMAAGAADVPEEHYDWAQKYLMCIRDERGNHPPNVQGILNHISNIRQDAKSNLTIDDCACAPYKGCSTAKEELNTTRNEGTNTSKNAPTTSTGTEAENAEPAAEPA